LDSDLESVFFDASDLSLDRDLAIGKLRASSTDSNGNAYFS